MEIGATMQRTKAKTGKVQKWVMRYRETWKPPLAVGAGGGAEPAT